MPKRDESKYNIKVQGEPAEVTEIREKILNSFSELEFVEEGHKYFLRGQELCSVSSVAQRFEEEFDAIEKSTAYAVIKIVGGWPSVSINAKDLEKYLICKH